MTKKNKRMLIVLSVALILSIVAMVIASQKPEPQPVVHPCEERYTDTIDILNCMNGVEQ